MLISSLSFFLFTHLCLYRSISCPLLFHPPPSLYGLSDEAIASVFHPQWHLTILICMYMPSLCGQRAAEIDQQRSGMFYYMSVRGRDHTQWAYTQACIRMCPQAGMYRIYVQTLFLLTYIVYLCLNYKRRINLHLERPKPMPTNTRRLLIQKVAYGHPKQPQSLMISVMNSLNTLILETNLVAPGCLV